MTHANHSKIDPSRLDIIAEELIHNLPEGYKWGVLHIPICAVRDPNLTSYAFAALALFIDVGNPSNADLMRRWGWGRIRARNAVLTLQAAGYLTQTRDLQPELIFRPD